MSAPSCICRRPVADSAHGSHRLRQSRRWLSVPKSLLQTSPSLESLLRQARRFAAPASTPLLLQGRNGTGKDVLARAVHAAPFQSGSPSCLSIAPPLPRDILASRLFGHAEGLHRRAAWRPRGRSDRPMAACCSSTRSATCRPTCSPTCCVLEGAVWRLGERRRAGSRCEVIAATNRPSGQGHGGRALPRRPLSSSQRRRLTSLPPLRERTGDIPPLVGHLLRDIAGAAPRHGSHRSHGCLPCATLAW